MGISRTPHKAGPHGKCQCRYTVRPICFNPSNPDFPFYLHRDTIQTAVTDLCIRRKSRLSVSHLISLFVENPKGTLPVPEGYPATSQKAEWWYAEDFDTIEDVGNEELVLSRYRWWLSAVGDGAPASACAAGGGNKGVRFVDEQVTGEQISGEFMDISGVASAHVVQDPTAATAETAGKPEAGQMDKGKEEVEQQGYGKGVGGEKGIKKKILRGRSMMADKEGQGGGQGAEAEGALSPANVAAAAGGDGEGAPEGGEIATSAGLEGASHGAILEGPAGQCGSGQGGAVTVGTGLEPSHGGGAGTVQVSVTRQVTRVLVDSDRVFDLSVYDFASLKRGSQGDSSPLLEE